MTASMARLLRMAWSVTRLSASSSESSAAVALLLSSRRLPGPRGTSAICVPDALLGRGCQQQ